MAKFSDLIRASSEQLVNLFYRINTRSDAPVEECLNVASKKLLLKPAQIVCGVGFNPAIHVLDDVASVLGFPSYEELAQRRNEFFCMDVYDDLRLANIIEIYSVVADDAELKEVMQYLLPARLATIEERIDKKVEPNTIERYKKEMKAIYAEGVAGIAFAESRLNNTSSGFRALINEVSIIVESRLIPVGDIFFRETVLPEEKRRILRKGMIPAELVETRLADAGISNQEKQMLEDYLELIR